MNDKIKFISGRVSISLAKKFKKYLIDTEQTIEEWLTAKIKESLKKK